jgi:hypothetical protein
MKDEQEARRKAFIEADEKEGVLRESITSLLSKFSSILAWFFSNNIFLIAYP